MKNAASAGFKYVWDNHLKTKTMEIGKAFFTALGATLTGEIGLAVAVALGGLLYTFDTKKTETVESKIKTAFQNNRIQEIESYLKAYQDCFRSGNDA